jgi:sugar lactone lactonase YvrE
MIDRTPSTSPDPVELPTPEAPALGGARALPVRVDTFAGDGTEGFLDGPAAQARFRFPRGLAVDETGTLYVADWENHVIRRITPDGRVSTLAGNGAPGFADGQGGSARFHFPRDLAVDRAGNVYVADTDNNRIRKITPAGVVTTLSGDGQRGFADGPRGSARFYYPNGVAVDASGVVYVADASNTRVRRVSPGGTVTTLAGDEVGGYADAIGSEARFSSPRAVAVDGEGLVYVADYGNSRIRVIAPNGRVTTLAGDGRGRHLDGSGVRASFKDPCALDVADDGHLYVADCDNHCIRRISPHGMVETIAGDGRGVPDYVDGPGSQARFCKPRGIAVGPAGVIYVADTSNHCIRRLTLG